MKPNLLSVVKTLGAPQGKEKHEKHDASGFEAALAHAQQGVPQVPPHADKVQQFHPLKKPAQGQQQSGQDAQSGQGGPGLVKAPIGHATLGAQSTHAELSESLAQKLEALQQGAHKSANASGKTALPATVESALAARTVVKPDKSFAAHLEDQKPAKRGPHEIAQPVAAPAAQKVGAPNPMHDVAPVKAAAPVAPSEFVRAAADDASLRIAVLSHAANVRVQTPDGDHLSLHLRVREGVANVTVTGQAPEAVEARASDLRAALATQGLSLGRIDLVTAAAAAHSADAAGFRSKDRTHERDNERGSARSAEGSSEDSLFGGGLAQAVQ